jgi:putative FmdB family regulatory protein
MPLFEFRCSTCSRDFELLVRAGEAPNCPECGTGDVEKLFSEAAAPAAAASRSLPITSACPPGDAPCSPNCCRL